MAPYLAMPLQFRDARNLTKVVRSITWVRHPVPPLELLEIHSDPMLRLCYNHPDIESKDMNKAIMMCMIHDLDEIIATDDTISKGTYQREWETLQTIADLEAHLRSKSPELACTLFNTWKEYTANETDLAKLFHEILDLVRFLEAYRLEKGAQAMYTFQYIERGYLRIDNDWLQSIADSILDAWITVKEIQHAGPFFFVFGGPGSGKTFVCERMAAVYGYEHVSLAALIEEEANNPGSAHSSIINTCRSDRLPIPVDLSISLLKDRLRQADGCRGVLLDGFPETMDDLRKFETEV
ncbi:unnamed protein product [Clonostachys rosea]|uniref:HD domain-containing protein n=1 Tax=Bionectria ochroleuca TaxID=29856 RepID=A0ABY6V1M5_BIOOC|nr:unnamed protein product [Clonostachys rosea]